MASQFGNQLKLKHCHNTWVDHEDMPTWGQLGCNGFIVIDGSDKVVCKASPAFLEVKQAAFRHVETLLDALISSQPAPKLVSGRVDPSVGGNCAKVIFDKKEDAEEVKNVQSMKVPSVKVDVLDEEHERCESKLALLSRLTEPGVSSKPQQIEEALQGLLAAYEDHFAHEEALLDEHLYSALKQDTGFSADKGARTSHFADHEAMLSAVRALLVDVSSFSASNVLQLAADFEKHATTYDGSYADRLSEAMANTPVAKAQRC